MASRKAQSTVAAYVRVSSASQNHAMQRDAIARAARARGDELGPDAWYADHASGGRMGRPSLDRLRQHAREGRISRLYLYRLDRLTRTGIRDTLDLVDELRRAGVELVTVADGFDVGGPAAEVVLAVLAWAAKAERTAINERISTAREAKRAKGEAWGRPSRMLAGDVERARSMRKEGRSLRAIAVALKVPKTIVARELAKVAPSRKPSRPRGGPGLRKTGK